METNYNKVKKGESWLYKMDADNILRDMKIVEKLNSAVQVEQINTRMFEASKASRFWISITDFNNQYNFIEKIPNE